MAASASTPNASMAEAACFASGNVQESWCFSVSILYVKIQFITRKECHETDGVSKAVEPPSDETQMKTKKKAAPMRRASGRLVQPPQIVSEKAKRRLSA